MSQKISCARPYVGISMAHWKLICIFSNPSRWRTIKIYRGDERYSWPVANSSFSVLIPPESPPIIERNGVLVELAVNNSPAKFGRLKVVPVPVTLVGII